jgi:two-component system response regulator RegA
VIVDLCLTVAHGADGLDVVTCVRTGCPSARIVVLTAYGSTATEVEARRLGADAFLQKPQPLTELRDTMAALLRSSA